jgi:tryptophanyl-tRNA synthetase
VTDSRAPGEPKDPEGSALFQIYQAFATPEETQALRAAYAAGIAWGEAKQMLFERIDREVAPMRARYQELIARPGQVEDILQAGAARARERARPLMQRLRHAVGLRNLGIEAQAAAGARPAKAPGQPQFKQYREADGLHYFKLVDASGTLLLQSRGFESPKDAGQAIARLKQGHLEGLEAVGVPAQGIAREQVEHALAQWGSAV